MILSLGGVGYVERQCFAFFKNPQTHHDQKEKIPGVFSYQENQISFSFALKPPKNRKTAEPNPLKPLRKFKILSFRGIFLKNLGFL